MQQLSAQDAQFLYMETNKSLSHVTAVGIFDPRTASGGHVRFKQIIEHVRSRLHTSPIYKRRILHVPLELDYPYWVDDEHFDIEYHIRHGRLPHPSDWRQLCIHLGRFHSRPLDMQRAPWEMYVIEGLDNIEGIPEGCYAVATKIHHAAADGMSLINFFNGLYDIDDQGTPALDLKPRVSSKTYEKPSIMQMSARGLISAARTPFKIADALYKNSSAIFDLAKQRLGDDNDGKPRAEVPNTRFNLETSPHRMFDAAYFKLDTFKQIRTLVAGATINDVVLAVCSAGLRKYLSHHKELPVESLKAFVPVNLRTTKQSAQDSDSDTGNRITTIAPWLFSHIQDPVERLALIQAGTAEQKSTKKGLSSRLATDITKELPASIQALTAKILTTSEIAGRLTNVCISNVPGPPVPVFMNGAMCVKSMGMGPLGDRMGLFIAVSSYNGEMSLSATSCRRTMPDIEFFIQCLEEGHAELLSAALQAEKRQTIKKPNKQVKANKTSNKARKKLSKKAVANKLPSQRKKRIRKGS